MFKTIEWTADGVVMLDQRRLPREEIYVTLIDYRGVAAAIADMIIRGAPAIGVAAAMGIALGAREIPDGCDREEGRRRFEEICRTLAATRPTAVNLFWAVERMKRRFAGLEGRPWPEIRRELEAEARTIHVEDVECNRRIGQLGQQLLRDDSTVLTHCNAGALATGGYGTALGVIRAVRENGRKIRVFADETRPFLQGARLTAWELQQYEIPVTVITDNMAGWFMAQGMIDAVVVGADRIAANGDTANKIGTFSVAVLAHYHGIPFYVAAPVSTLDLGIPSGRHIPIEERNSREVTHMGDIALTPAGVDIRNPAFDVTPNHLVTAIISERGIARAPYVETLAAWRG
jgi:methylthioribose-1-phosphate isomerase